MHTQRLKHIIKQHLKTLNKTVADIQKDFNKDAIHDFRVQVKKLRSLLRALAIKLPKEIKAVYAAAGQLRDIQLQRDEIVKAAADNAPPNEYLSLLDQELQGRKDAFERIAQQCDLLESKKKLYKKLPHKLGYKNIGDFLHQQIAGILMLIDTGLSADNDLHSTRKKIKDIVYINKLYKKELRSRGAATLLNKKSLKETISLSDELGKFVDKWVGLSFLQPDRLSKVPAAEREQLESICRRWQLQKHTYRQELSGKISPGSFRALAKK